MYQRLLQGIQSLNQSKFFAGIVMLLMNIGSKYITIELSENQQELLRNSIIRQLFIFTIVWMGTRDIVAALILTAVFTILTQYLFHENSRLCILPKQLRQLKKSIDVNNDNVLSQDEINRAIRILSEANNKNQSNHR